MSKELIDQKRILVIDDEKEVRDLIVEMLSKNNFFVLGAASGQEGLDLAKKEKFDLILLDIAMPMMDGYQACEKLKASHETRKTPVVFLTGKDLESQNLLEHCKLLSVAGYISKMSSLKELLEDIRKVLSAV